MVTTKPMSADEFMALPDDGSRCELIRGVPHRMPPPEVEHGGIGAEIPFALKGYADPRRLGLVVAETGLLFERDPRIVRVPDVAFIRTERLPPRAEWRGYSTVPPDLAVEVISPTDASRDVADKVGIFLAHGEPLVWVVFPTPRRVAVHRFGRDPLILGQGEVLDGEDVLPGFRLSVATIFA